MKTDRPLGLLGLALFAAELLLILGSWMAEALAPSLPVRSLLSFDGVRWLFGSFTDTITTPVLAWLLVVAMACGAARKSRLSGLWRKGWKGLQYRERMGLWTVAAELSVALMVILALTCLPHAVLLNVTGHLFPGMFPSSIVPCGAFVLLVCSLSYGSTSGSITSVAEAYGSMVHGLRLFAPLMPLYVLLMQLVGSVKFVFML